MIRRITSAALSILAALCFFCLSAKAQTTYHGTTPKNCDQASVYPISNFDQFQCRGITLTDSTGAVVGSFNLIGLNMSHKIVEVYAPRLAVTPNGYFNNDVTLVSFTQPYNDSNGVFHPGTLQFNWQELNNFDGTYWTGTASGTWEDAVFCGGRGCGWHYPKLLTFATTVN